MKCSVWYFASQDLQVLYEKKSKNHYLNLREKRGKREHLLSNVVRSNVVRETQSFSGRTTHVKTPIWALLDYSEQDAGAYLHLNTDIFPKGSVQLLFREQNKEAPKIRGYGLSKVAHLRNAEAHRLLTTRIPHHSWRFTSLTQLCDAVSSFDWIMNISNYAWCWQKRILIVNNYRLFRPTK